MKAFSRIVFLTIASAVLYGLIHDQVTARICIEYFTVGHPRMIASEDPTVLGLYWGIAATWWAGLMIGIPLGLSARIGRWPKLTGRKLLPGIVVLLVTMATMATITGTLAGTARNDMLRQIAPEFAEQISPDRHHLFLADMVAHSTSYLVGFVGGIVLISVTIVKRSRLARQIQSRPPAMDVVK